MLDQTNKTKPKSVHVCERLQAENPPLKKSCHAILKPNNKTLVAGELPSARAMQLRILIQEPALSVKEYSTLRDEVFHNRMPRLRTWT